jgi:hypothetical protein
MVKANSALAGREDGFVTPRSEDQTASGLSFVGTFPETLNGRSVDIKASVEPGPVISMLPISKRRSSTMTGGFCFFDTARSAVHVCKNADGCTRMNILCRGGFFLLGTTSSTPVISTSSERDLAHHIIVTGAIGLLSPSRS